jgi:ankyrin repeat protein
MFETVQTGHLEIVKVLIKHGADVDKPKTDVGATPLLIAAQKGHLEIVKVLLENGANIDKSTDDGIAPLFIAVQEGYLEIVQLLLANRAEGIFLFFVLYLSIFQILFT